MPTTIDSPVTDLKQSIGRVDIIGNQDEDIVTTVTRYYKLNCQFIRLMNSNRPEAAKTQSWTTTTLQKMPYRDSTTVTTLASKK